MRDGSTEGLHKLTERGEEDLDSARGGDNAESTLYNDGRNSSSIRTRSKSAEQIPPAANPAHININTDTKVHVEP